MKNSQPESSLTSKRRGPRFWLGCLTLLLGLPFLLYYGYCWGLWGRQSLLLQYLFQCSCPAASTEARYPEHVDVIVPACEYISSILSPSGRLLFVWEKDSEHTSIYLWDLQTEEKIPSPLPEQSRFNFLTDHLLYVSLSYEEAYIFDGTSRDHYRTQRFSALRPDAMEGGNANPVLLAEALRQAKYVFFRDDGTIIALDPDFPASSEKNFITGWFDLPTINSGQVEQFLSENNIAYQTIRADFPEEVISPDGKFVARTDGIYLVATGQKIVEGYSASGSFRPYSRKYFNVRGWTYDSTAAIYSEFLSPCLIETTFFIFDDYSCYFEVPQPVIKVKVPEEYLLPRETP
jgi:hypothetical protein